MELETNLSPKVSVITACYNTAAYLEKCINSLLQSDYDNKELIFINDGSTDETDKILEKYRSHPEIVIITQKNQGLSAALNTGIRAATGKYIQVVDSDDWISPDLIRKSVEEAERTNADLVYTAHCIAIEEDIDRFRYEEKPIIESRCSSNREVFETLFKNIVGISDEQIYDWKKNGCLLRETIPGYNTSRLYRRDLIINNEIWFDTDVTMKMDCIFNLYYFIYASRTSYIEGPQYFYRIRNDGTNSVAQVYKNEEHMYKNKLALLKARNKIRQRILKERHFDIINTYCGSISLSAIEVAICCAKRPQELGYKKYKEYLSSGVWDSISCLKLQFGNFKFNCILALLKLHCTKLVYLLMKLAVRLKLDEKLRQ